MSKRTQRFDPNDKGDQFIAEMASIENPWNILLAYDAKNCLVWLTQNSRHNFIAFQSPEALREAAKIMIDMADKWETGAIPGLAPPEDDEEDEGDDED